MECCLSARLGKSLIFLSLVTSYTPGIQAGLLELSLEDLMQMEVTSVSKNPQGISSAPAAIYVLTSEDIVSSGATSIPDALRMVPGMQVAQIDANKWSISSRGFGSRFANKMLVLMDGRSVYAPSFGGVYWELQHTLLDDIERIEVIRGPGASLWGSNAVNGVINIITKSASDTQGSLVSVLVGDQENSAAFRYGGKISDGWNYRFSGNYRRYDDSALWPVINELGSVVAGDAKDGWSMSQLGFRMDGDLNENNRITVQGDAYSQTADQVFSGSFDPVTIVSFSDQEIEQAGANILGRWTHTTDSGSTFVLQSYLEETSREEVIQDEKRTNWDIDFQFQFAGLGHHDLMMGGGYRYSDHKTTPTNVLLFAPDDEDFKLTNFFVQDDISFYDRDVHLLLGLKAEKNDYTDVEYQPSLRLSWQINPRHLFWAAASRAVRLPSRVEVESTVMEVFPPNSLSPVPILLQIKGNDRIEAEELKSYELGLRSTLSEDTVLDLTVFHNDYADLILADPSSAPFLTFVVVNPFIPIIAPVLVVPLTFANESASGSNDIIGAELLIHKNIEDKLSIKLGYTYTNTRFRTQSLTGAPINPGTLSRNAMNQATFQARYHISDRMWVDLAYKYVDDLENVDVDKYNSVNLGFHWKIQPGLTLSLVGTDVSESNHLEFRPEVFQTEVVSIERAYYGTLVWEF